MNGVPMYRATLLLETGALKHVYVPGRTAHEARRTIAGWIGRQHTDAVRLVNLAPVDRTPKHAAPSRAAHHALLCSLVMAALFLLLLHYLLTNR